LLSARGSHREWQKKNLLAEDEKALESQSSRRGKSLTPRRINCVALTAGETVILPLG